MLAQVTSATVLGVDACLVRVEVDVAAGLPCMNVVGLPESAVREGRERVSAALQNAGHPIPPKRITVNLAPADIRKEGSAFDFPIALALLGALGVVPRERLRGLCAVGELGLDGELRAVRGVLSIALKCRAEPVSTLLVPAANAREAAIVGGVDVRAVNLLSEAIAHLRDGVALSSPPPAPSREPGPATIDLDLADVRGQDHAKRALEVAAAGGHNLLLIGPPGAGKSMLARRLPAILPGVSPGEALEITKVHSVAGRLRPGQALVRWRPFRAPHHTISDAGLIGGGSVPRPGEVSLAHHGVLFLDELPEFRRHVLEALRQPLEDGAVSLGRARQSVIFPARFMLVAAMNPCPCGYFGAMEAGCTCNWTQVQRYRARVSGPLLDRIDLHVEVPTLRPRELTDTHRAEPSSRVRERVLAARDRQDGRFRAAPGVFSNAQMTVKQLRAHCKLEEPAADLLRQAAGRLQLSARGYHRLLKVARTIADLAGAKRVGPDHLAEAVQYRSLDRRGSPEQRFTESA